MGLLLFLLALNVSRQRRKARMSCGVPEDQTHPLFKAVVAHRNAAEFIPMFAVLMLACEMEGAPNWMVWVFLAAVSSRFLHAFSILNFATVARPNLVRVAGAALTYVSGIVMALALLIQTVAHTPGPLGR